MRVETNNKGGDLPRRLCEQKQQLCEVIYRKQQKKETCDAICRRQASWDVIFREQPRTDNLGG